MKKTLLPALLLLASAAHGDAGQPDFSVAELLQQVKGTIRSVEDYPRDLGLPPVSRIKLDLKATRADQGHLGVNLVMLQIGRDIQNEVVQSISLELTRDDLVDGLLPSNVPNISEALSQAIINTANAVQEAKLLGLGIGSLTVSVRFGVTSDEKGGLSLKILDSVGVSVGSGIVQDAIQQVSIEFRSIDERPPLPGPDR